MKRRFLPLLSAAVLVSPNLSAGAEEAGWKPVFPHDGPPAGFVVRDWADVARPAEGNPLWTVKNGVLTADGTRGCWLMSEKEYSDFSLEYEFRLGPRGNSGLALRAPLKGDPAFDGMELQMADFRYNPQAKDSELTGGIYRAIAPAKQVYKPGEWNALAVKLEGSKLTVTLNGAVIQDTDLLTHGEPVSRHDNSAAPPVKDRPAKGHIGFQNLSRDGGIVEIRNARIAEKPAPPASRTGK